MSRSSKLFLPSLCVLVLCLLPTAAKADPLVLTLDPTHTVAVGGTATFQGTFTNAGSPDRFVNSVGFSFSGGFSDFTFDPTDFFNAVPPLATAGFTTGALPVNFFTVFVDPLATPGTYTGSFSVLGGDSGSAQNVLATADFTLIVQAVPAAVPEPATLALLATGLAGAFGSKRVRRRFTKS